MLEALHNPFTLACIGIGIFAAGFGTGQLFLLLWESFAGRMKREDIEDMHEYQAAHLGDLTFSGKDTTP